MAAISLNTAVTKTPQIYAYSALNIPELKGWVKIGYTEGDVEKRISQQTHTARVRTHTEWSCRAVFDNNGLAFHDTDFHAYLRRNNVEYDKGTEWFHLTGDEALAWFNKFRNNRERIKSETPNVIPYTLRKEQQEAVAKARDYFYLHKDGEFLWNAKPRFGKTQIGRAHV